MKIALVGDQMTDKYYHAVLKENPEHINPCYKVIKTELKEGGAGNVAANLKSLNVSFRFFHPPAECIKTRVICNGSYVCRIDVDKKSILRGNELIKWEKFDYIVVSDYLKGAITKRIAQDIMESGAKVIVDTKPIHAHWFKGAYILKINLVEAVQVCQLGLDLKRDFETVVITRGERGIEVIHKEGDWSIPGHKVPIVDVTGAGDTVLATLVYGLSKGMTILDACKLANKAGAISVQHLGCYAVKRKELQ